MNLLAPVAAAGLALSVGVALSLLPTKAAQQPPEAAQRPASPAPLHAAAVRYVLTAPGFGTCSVERAATADRNGFALKADAACNRLLPGLAEARFWQERKDGAVVFSRTGRDELVNFGPGDGVGYESFRPAAAIISMNEADG